MIRPRIDTSKQGIREMGNVVVAVCKDEADARALAEKLRAPTPVDPAPTAAPASDKA